MCRSSDLPVYSFPSSPSEEEITITRMLDKVLKRSDAVDKESLWVLAGQRVSILKVAGDI
jgi:exosome complex component RRP45